MNGFMELIYDGLFHPAQAMRKVAEEKLLLQGTLIFLLSVLISSGAVYSGVKAAGYAKHWGLILGASIVGGLALWLIGAAVLHMVAELCGGRGSAAALLSALGLAHLPRVFLAPASLLAMLLPTGPSALVMALTGLAIGLWVLGLEVAAIRAVYRFSTARAILVLFLPLIVTILTLIGLVVAIVSMATPLLHPW